MNPNAKSIINLVNVTAPENIDTHINLNLNRVQKSSEGKNQFQNSMNDVNTKFNNSIGSSSEFDNSNPNGVFLDSERSNLDTEFIYYNTLLKDLLPTVTNVNLQDTIKHWIIRLYSPEYESNLFHLKRNKYLLHIVLCIMGNNFSYLILNLPPQGALPSLSNVELANAFHAEWENDTLWEEILNDLDRRIVPVPMRCSIHGARCPGETTQHETVKMKTREVTISDILLDSEFRYLLYLVKSYIHLLSFEFKPLLTSWLQLLCSINEMSCILMKSIRNDYIQLLLAYAQDLRFPLIFQNISNSENVSLPPLELYIRQELQHPQNSNQSGYMLSHFIKQINHQRNGAVCFISVNGDVINNFST